MFFFFRGIRTGVIDNRNFYRLNNNNTIVDNTVTFCYSYFNSFHRLPQHTVRLEKYNIFTIQPNDD